MAGENEGQESTETTQNPTSTEMTPAKPVTTSYFGQGRDSYQRILREETGWKPTFRVSPADAAGIEASRRVKAARNKAYTGENYRGLTLKVPDLKTVGWEKWSTNLKVTWKQLEIMDVALGVTQMPVPAGKLPTEKELDEMLCWQRIDNTARYYLEQSLSKEYLHII